MNGASDNLQTPEAIEMAQASISEVIRSEESIKLSKNPLFEGPFVNIAQAMRKAARENKRAMHDMNIRENYKPCRKKCKLFKCNECYKKTFEEQKKCYESRQNNI